jgi:hypothetical protein
MVPGDAKGVEKQEEMAKSTGRPNILAKARAGEPGEGQSAASFRIFRTTRSSSSTSGVRPASLSAFTISS